MGMREGRRVATAIGGAPAHVIVGRTHAGVGHYCASHAPLERLQAVSFSILLDGLYDGGATAGTCGHTTRRNDSDTRLQAPWADRSGDLD
jgi:hypothetical protein